ncbi:MAG: T9SS type A sorting domain-containing protein [Bacteroidia bacterium]|nr:T9SS type A sorting domain-containing protein [Bacteroidia bacterium]
MNKLFTSILTVAVLTSTAQERLKRASVINMQAKIAAKNKAAFEKEKYAKAVNSPAGLTANKSAAAPGFNSFSNSSNIYGVTINAAKPLQYNNDINVVSFIHRRPIGYVGAPTNNTGVIVAMISANQGANWDSTCVYSDANNVGRYPQGGLYNPPGNTSVNNAYVIACGPALDGGGSWAGSYFASKQLGTYNTLASQTPGAQQYFSTTGPFGPNVYSNDWPVYGFNSTDDGKVRAMGQLCPDPDVAPIDAKGAVIQSGTFNAGIFNWKTDSIVPPVIAKGDGFLQMNSNAYMAWNEAGNIGYVVFIGSRTGATGSNKGWQPIVYKTTNSGTSWSLLSGIDFNAPAYATVLNRLDGTTIIPSLKIPFFNTFEGLDCAVDANNKLHIAAVLATTTSDHNDSLAFTPGYDVEEYTWPHTTGKHPYLYDFMTDGTSWNYITVDSITSEAPAATSGFPGFAENPWDDDAGKVTSDSRIQLSRSADGQFIIYTWAESDPNFTNGGKFWNTIPNVKARIYDVATATLHASEINVTKPAIGANPNVASRAMFHFTSPSAISVSAITGGFSAKVPMTVTTSNPYIQGSPNTHYYASDALNFSNVGINENEKDALQFSVFPNPANDKCVVSLNLNEPASLEISVLNYLGQPVKRTNHKAQFGTNDITLDIAGLKSGVYFVNVKNGNVTSTKKLVVE